MKTNENQSLESLIAAIQELLYELKNEQDDILTKLDKHHKATMQQLHVLREFDQISDMTNQIFERRLSSIEQTIKERKKTYKKYAIGDGELCDALRKNLI